MKNIKYFDKLFYNGYWQDWTILLQIQMSGHLKIL